MNEQRYGQYDPNRTAQETMMEYKRLCAEHGVGVQLTPEFHREVVAAASLNSAKLYRQLTPACGQYDVVDTNAPTSFVPRGVYPPEELQKPSHPWARTSIYKE